MNICSTGHEEICFEGRKCPFCDELATKEAEINRLNEDIHDLKNEIRDLQKTISELEES